MTRNATLFFCTLISLLALPLGGCAVRLPQASPYASLELPQVAVSEAQLLDVVIAEFSFETPQLKRGTPDLQLVAVREAESRYMPVMLRDTLMHAGAWGSIHVLPSASPGHDVRIEGEILKSESHTLSLHVTVTDATGAQWFESIYTEHVGEAVHGDDALGVNDPFDSLYNRIANDMLLHAQALTAADIAQIRDVASLQFGNAFAPEVFGAYLGTDRKGITRVVRLPPESDPTIRHLHQIRLRDRAFHDVLQPHYLDFVSEIGDSYFEYRRQSYRELRELQRQQRDARNDILGGAVLLGVAAATSNIDDALATIGAATTAAVGVAKVVRGVNNYSTDSPFFAELDESFGNEVVTEVNTLDEDVVQLSGTVEGIYEQWREILRELLREERGLPME